MIFYLLAFFYAITDSDSDDDGTQIQSRRGRRVIGSREDDLNVEALRRNWDLEEDLQAGLEKIGRAETLKRVRSYLLYVNSFCNAIAVLTLCHFRAKRFKKF